MNNSGTLQFSKFEKLIDDTLGEASKNLLHKYSLALTHLTNMTISFEGRFDTDPAQFSYEELSEILDAQKFLKSLGREHNRVNEVEKEMSSRTIWEQK